MTSPSPWPGKVGASLCETCGLEPMAGVYGLTEMPASAGIGEKCLAEHAEPFRWLRIHVAACTARGVVDTVAYQNWLDGVRTYVDGTYVKLRDAILRYPVTEQEVARQKAWQERAR